MGWNYVSLRLTFGIALVTLGRGLSSRRTLDFDFLVLYACGQVGCLRTFWGLVGLDEIVGGINVSFSTLRADALMGVSFTLICWALLVSMQGVSLRQRDGSKWLMVALLNIVASCCNASWCFHIREQKGAEGAASLRATIKLFAAYVAALAVDNFGMLQYPGKNLVVPAILVDLVDGI